jgi:hypothetical protein
MDLAHHFHIPQQTLECVRIALASKLMHQLLAVNGTMRLADAVGYKGKWLQKRPADPFRHVLGQ